ncbi:hypothetical protein SAMN02745728_02198 [Desulfovibrio litoralis DSM 11393]|uniref:Lipoprotein n=2 Tax=Desulfovibrio litoralis TaxID=466107 RepID=A0A1M7TLB1_9BACT|nr:hypothetical protein SAMN02745728_02198 [Desulfovibrio litoralis DSM 11393]
MKIIKIVFLFILTLATVGCSIKSRSRFPPDEEVSVINRCSEVYTYSMEAPEMTGVFISVDNSDNLFSGIEYTVQPHSPSNHKNFDKTKSSNIADLINGKKFTLTIKKDGKVVRTYTERVFQNAPRYIDQSITYSKYIDDFIVLKYLGNVTRSRFDIIFCGSSN